MDSQQPQQLQEDTSLETNTTQEVSSRGPTPANPGAPQAPKVKRTIGQRLRGLLGHFNPYLLAFILLLVLTAIGLYVLNAVRSAPTDPTVKPNTTNQKLTDDALKQLNNTDVKIGDPKQVLGIESNTIFAGKVLIRDSLDVAGSLKLGGSLSLSGLTVSGVSVLDQIQANSMSLSGNGAVQGQLTVQKGLSVNGGASFGGPITAPQITVDTLQLNRDLVITKHIDAGGATPGKSDGGALGGGGTSSVSGSDTAGTVAINTGGSPPTGCFVTITFAQKFSGTPHVVITPVSSAAATIDYYINRSGTGFSICTASAPSAGQNYTFDYIAID